jgi:hypothetical protein
MSPPYPGEGGAVDAVVPVSPPNPTEVGAVDGGVEAVDLPF